MYRFGENEDNEVQNEALSEKQNGVIDIESVKEEDDKQSENEDTFLNTENDDTFPFPDYVKDRHDQGINNSNTMSVETPVPAMQATGTSIGLLPSLINALGNRQKKNLVNPSAVNADTLTVRLQQAREARAFDHIIMLEEKMSQCRQFVREVCSTALWQHNKADIDSGKKDAKDFFLELAHGKSQEHLELNDRIKEMALGLRDFERQVRQVKNACEKAGLDSSEVLHKAESFLDEFQRSQASSLIPDPADGVAFHEKIKEMLKHVREVIQSLLGKPDEDNGPDIRG